jgi:hypothetical protein
LWRGVGNYLAPKRLKAAQFEQTIERAGASAASVGPRPLLRWLGLWPKTSELPPRRETDGRADETGDPVWGRIAQRWLPQCLGPILA